MKRTIALLSLIVVYALQTAVAQQDTLVYKYRRLAVDYQQRVKMAEHRLSGAESELDASKSGYLPRFDFTGRFNYYGVPLQLAPPAEAPVGTPGEELHNFYSLDLTLTQPIITGGYLKNSKMAAMSKVEIMRNYLQLSKQDILLNADLFYWNVVSKKEISKLIGEYHDAVGEFMKTIQDRVDEEIVGRDQLYQTMVRYDNSKYMMIKAEKEYETAIMELNTLVGFPVDTLPLIADTLPIVMVNILNDSLTEKALTQRPEIGMLQNQISMNMYREKITASQYNPHLGIGAGGKWGAPSPGLQIDPGFNYYLNASLAIPIFYWGEKREKVSASRQKTEVARLQLEKTKEDVTLEVRRSYNEMLRSREQLNFAMGSLDNASKNVSVMLDRYNEGLSSVLEVLNSQVFWEKSYFNYIQAKYDLNVAYSKYQRAMGELTEIK
jgi:outer membrane protein TolC